MKTIKVPLRLSFTGTLCDIPTRLGYFTGSSICAPIDKFVEVEFVDDTSRPPYVYPECDLVDSLLDRLKFLPSVKDVQIRWKSDIELGMGLGGSSALLVAVARYFLCNWKHQAELAGLVEIENNAGWQDPAIVSFGRTASFLYRHDGFTIRETFRALDSQHFMLISTQQKHDTSKQYGDPVQLTSDFVKDNEDRNNRFGAAVTQKNYQRIGEIITETYYIKKQRSNYVTVEMDSFFHEALNLAFGGRLMGSGGGGHFIFVLPVADRDKLRRLVDAYNYVEIPFNFYDRDSSQAAVDSYTDSMLEVER